MQTLFCVFVKQYDDNEMLSVTMKHKIANSSLLPDTKQRGTKTVKLTSAVYLAHLYVHYANNVTKLCCYD